MHSRPTKTQAFISFANNLSDFCGRIISWLVVIMVLVTIAVITSRALFKNSSPIAEESLIYMFGILFMVGVVYTLRHNNHVRVDIFYSKMSIRSRAWVDLAGTLLFLVPFCIVVFWVSLKPVIKSWSILEGAIDSGIPAIFILKSFLLVMPVLILIQGIANALSCIQILQNKIQENS